MSRDSSSGRTPTRALLREPLVHFFAIGAFLFLAHRVVAGDSRTIVVTPALKAELSRRFRDANGRRPEPAELARAVHEWERDEALFREALRERLDRDDFGVRAALIDKMHARAAFEVRDTTPSDAELQAWLDAHRDVYETPRGYDFEFLAFPKTDPGARDERDKVEHAIATGADPKSFGRPVVGGNMSVADMQGRVEPELVARIPSMPLMTWQPLETPKSFLLARVKRVGGGMPTLEQVRGRVTEDYKRAHRNQAVDRILQRTVDRYRFVEKN